MRKRVQKLEAQKSRRLFLQQIPKSSLAFLSFRRRTHRNAGRIDATHKGFLFVVQSPGHEAENARFFFSFVKLYKFNKLLDILRVKKNRRT